MPEAGLERSDVAARPSNECAAAGSQQLDARKWKGLHDTSNMWINMRNVPAARVRERGAKHLRKEYVRALHHNRGAQRLVRSSSEWPAAAMPLRRAVTRAE